MTELDIRNQLQSAGKARKASEIAAALKIAPSTVKRWIDGGDIPAPMLALLDLYFFGTIPFEIANEKLMHGILDFTEDQWRVISILAKRKSMTPGKWIADKIRWMLAGDQEARNELDAIHAERRKETNPLQVYSPQKVAEDPAAYGAPKINLESTEAQEEA